MKCEQLTFLYNNLLDIGDDVIEENAKPNITKRFWQYIKAKRKDSFGISVLKSDGKEITDPKRKADILNNQHNRRKPCNANFGLL